VIPSIAKLLRFASLAICAIVIASFAIFALNQTSTASKHQSEEVSNGPSSAVTEAAGKASKEHEGSVHKVIDEASSQLTSPFAGVVSGSSSEWLTRGVELLLALIVYGLGFGYLARVLTVRV
jgi:hypothetical protein